MKKRLFRAVFALLVLASALAAASCRAYFGALDLDTDRSVSQTEFLQVVPLRSVYSLGETFDPAAGLAVYRSTAAGTLKPVPPSDWTSVTIAPDGEGPEPAANFMFENAGSHTVEVQALGMSGSYDLWAAAGQPVMTITYVDGASGKMKQNAKGEWVVATPEQKKMIYSFTTVNVPTGDPGWTYLMGRPDDDATPIKLNISPTGRLEFRPPSAQHNMYTPVGTVAEMQFINTVPDALKGSYYQETDLDLLGGAGNAARYKWKPIGNGAAPFTGTFDGSKKSLGNIYINEPSSDGMGLFGYLNGSALLRNIRLESGSVTGNDDTGGIAGSQKDDTASIRIINCSNGAAVRGAGYSIAGIIGNPLNGAFIAGCRNSGDVHADGGNVGGIAGGYDAAVSIIACYNTGDVWSTGTNRVGINPIAVGGIAGVMNNGPGSMMIACYNNGTIRFGGDRLGGILGKSPLEPEASYWNSAAPGTQAPCGRYDHTNLPHDDHAEPYNGESDFPDVKAAHIDVGSGHANYCAEWGPGGGAAWDGTGAPPVGGWWDQNTITGGTYPNGDPRLPRLWWE